MSVKKMKHMEKLSTRGAFIIAKNYFIVYGIPALLFSILFSGITFISFLILKNL